MFQRCFQQQADGDEMKLEKDWVSKDEISNYVQLAVVCSEDQNYLKHNGFDLGAIKKAMKYNEKMEEKIQISYEEANKIKKDIHEKYKNSAYGIKRW